MFFVLLSFVVLSGSGYKLSVYYNSSGIDSKELLLIAYAMWIISNSIISMVTNEIRMENIRGTLEYKLLALVPFEFLVLAQIISSLLIQVLETIIILILAKIFFGIQLRVNFLIILFVIVTCLGMYGMSLTLGAIVINKKKIGQLSLIVQVLLLFLSNVFTVSKIGFVSKIIPRNG